MSYQVHIWNKLCLYNPLPVYKKQQQQYYFENGDHLKCLIHNI